MLVDVIFSFIVLVVGLIIVALGCVAVLYAVWANIKEWLGWDWRKHWREEE